MAEVTRAWRWPCRRVANGCWLAGRPRTPVCREARPCMLSEMKRKVMNPGKLRLSPNEEAFILKEDYERRRKLRLLQVREQERGIAFQIREDVKQRKNQQFSSLAEELRAEWEKAQNQKVQNLEKLYLASLRHMGEGHRQAKENEPDLDALARRAAERKRKAEMRHKEALKVQKSQKEVLMKQKTRHIKARKEALLVEKERSAKVARLPPPVPAPFENIEINRIPSLKTNSSTYHHISTFVSRQLGTKQPDAHLAAEEEARRLEELRKQAAQERMEQCERAHVRGSEAMKKVHLAHTQERLLEELKQLQKEDLARRRQTVAQMPPRLVEPPYRRSEVKEDWQRELEFAFEDMYNSDRKVKGNLILHLTPEPLPAMSDHLQDEELDLSMERENRVPFGTKAQQIPSRILFKRLLNKIRSQKSLWTIKSMSEDESEMATSISEVESKAPTMESGAIVLEEGTLSSEQEQVMDSDRLTIDSGPLSSEGTRQEQAVVGFPPVTTVAQGSVLLHPQEEAVRIRMSARHKQIMEIEKQKQKQLELLEQIEQQKLRLETDCFRAQLEEEEKRKKTQQPEVCPAPVSYTMISDEDCHRQMIRNYQHQLLHQNRLHRRSVETARKRLLEYQTILKERYPSTSPTSLIPDSIISGPPQKPQKPAAASEHWDLCQRLKLSSNKYQPAQSSQIPELDQRHIQALRQGHFPQRQGEVDASEMLAKRSVGSQEHGQQFSPVEEHQRDFKFVPQLSHALSRTLSYDRPQLLQGAGELSKPLKAITCQTLDSQQLASEDSENISSKPTEPSSFLPLVPERSFTSLPVKLASMKVQEPFTTISKSRVPINQSVISQMHDQPSSSSDTITAQQDDFKFLQKQLELQKEVLQARQEAQEKLAFCAQKELEKQAGLPVFIPLSTGHLFTSLPSASAGSGKLQTYSTESDATVSSGKMDKLWGFSQPVLPQQTNLEFPQEQMRVQKDNLQARREAQEVSLAHKLDDVHSEQAGHCWSHQVPQQSFSSLTETDRLSRKIQEQPLPTNKKGLLPSQSEISRSQDGSSSSLQQTLPLYNSLKLLQERLATQSYGIQTRDEVQEELLLHREGSLGSTLSGPGNSLSSVVPQHSDASRVVSEPGPGKSQELYSSEENVVPSNHLITTALAKESLRFPQHILPRQEHFTTLQEQAHIQRVILGARKETQEYAHKENELEKGLSSQQTGSLSSLSQVAELERFQEFISVQGDSTGPLSLKIPGFQERLVRFPQHAFPLQNNLQENQEWVNTEKESFQLNPQTLENSSSQQTVFSSFVPSLGPSSCVSLSSADSGTTQQPLSTTESDSKVTSIHLQIPELQDRLLKISQLIQPQQDSLKALQEQLATQREAIVQSRQEAQEEMLREWKERAFPKQTGSPSPPIAQHSLASFPLSDSERTQELCSTISDDAVSSGSEMLGLPGRALGLSHTALFQQNNLPAHPEHLHAQTNSFHSTEKAQEEMVFTRPCEHFIQPHHDDLKALQQQLDVQRIAIRSGQEIQEELLLQRLNKLEQRVSCKQTSSSLVSPRVALPGANSEGTLQSFPTKSDHTEIPSSHGEYLSFSQPLPPQQDKLTMQMDLEMVFHKKLLLHKQNSQDKSDSLEQATPALYLSKETEHPFIPLPFAEAKSKSICELYLPKKEHEAPSSDAVIPRLQDRLLSYSQPVLTQQDNMTLQTQLSLQREALSSRQRAQEELLVQRQTALQQQIEKHRETVKDFLNVSQAQKSTGEDDLKTQGPAWNSDQESASGESLGKELSRRASKPPVSKVKCGLDLDQHELSTIQEVESPASGRTPMPGSYFSSSWPGTQYLDEASLMYRVNSRTDRAAQRSPVWGKSDFYRDRDPLRVSISREQSFLGSPLARDSFGCHQPPAQNSSSHGYAEAVKVEESDVEDHVILSHAASEEACTSLGPIVKLDDKAETQGISQEALSSVTVSTGSFLSYEITDLSLTDPESFSEQTEHQEQESTRKEETSPFSCAVPSTPVTYQQLHSLAANESLLSTKEERASDHTRAEQTIDKDRNEANLISDKRDLQVPAVDFPELEHAFRHVHHQLFKPLEPWLDFDLSSSSGISQDNRDFYQGSESSSKRHHVKESTDCFTELRVCLEPAGNPAHVTAQSFPAEGPEQSFQQLLPEFSSQESQHADLPSIYSIEARGTSQSMEIYNYSEQTEILQDKKSVHFQPPTENLSTVCGSSDDVAVFDQLQLQHSTPCGSTSTSSECSMKQLGSREEMLGFEELSRTVVTGSQSQRLTEDESGALNPHEETDSKGTPLSTENEKSVQNIIKTETTKAVRQAQRIMNLESFSSSIPVWETESGYGIMEEPDLTLLSISDLSITETDLANLTLEEKDSGGQSSFQAGASPSPLPDTSGHGVASEEPCVDQVAPSATGPTRKKSFMERSYQRQREMRNKAQLPQTGSSVSRLKGVSKVRVSLPEDRKTSQALMHQRALRLYRQLTEVKKEREEKAKQELCAQNRARAKEFHKKTLEKLRAKNTC